ncbi:MAG: cyclase family protein [Candidatus Promineifilaceae bacterium]
MAIIDISRMLSPRTAVWPGDTPFALTPSLERRRGHSVNLTSLALSAHTGTHVDAPRHFSDGGPAVAELGLRPFWGRAQVVSVSKPAGPIYPADLTGYDLGRARRLLVRSAASGWDPGRFPAAFVYPSLELAAHLGRAGIILYGSDTPSMDAEDSKTLEGHRALERQGIAILEWLDLSAAEDGVYELAALPLKIEAGDGSPVRAALRGLRAE